ncbi:MAG: phosphoglycerate kinase, partial [Rhodothermales bacterium]
MLKEKLSADLKDAMRAKDQVRLRTIRSLRAALMEKEIETLTTLMKKPKAPFTVVMGGAKVSEKIGVILNLLDRCNNLLI